MKNLWLALCALACVAAGAAEDGFKWPDGAERIVATVFYSDDDAFQKFAAERAPWKVVRQKKYFVIDIDALEYAQLVAGGFKVELDVERTTDMNAVRRIDPNQRAGIPGFACYRTVAETYATAAQLAADNPQLASWIDIGDTWEKQNGFGGEDLMVLRLTNSAIAGPKPALFAMSAIHAREYATAELNTRFAEHLVNGYGSDADATWILDHHEVHLLLQSNPDGRKQAQTGILWRKNTNQNFCSPTSNNRGADLNRNFSVQWGCCGGSSGNSCAETYRGTAPFSEPETDAVQAYTTALFGDNRGPNLTDLAPAETQGIYIDIHSFSELVLWPWGYTGTAAPNGPAMQTLGRRFAFANGYLPEQAIGLGVTDGTTDDFHYGELGVAAYTFEIGTNFFQDCGSFENQIYPDNLEALIYAAKTVRAPYLIPSGPEAVGAALVPAGVFANNVTTLSASIDDTRFNNSGGVEAVQNIIAAEYTINTPPWDPAAVPVALPAADGSFNSSTESVTASIDTTGLPGGQHTVYVRGRDASGAYGPVSAALLFVLDPATAPRVTGRLLAADTGLPIEATLVAGNFSTTSDPATGDYELLLLPGDYAIQVNPLDAAYGSLELGSFSLAELETVNANAVVYPFCDLFADDMEAGASAWTSQGAWALTQEQAASPTTAWSDSPGGNYGNNVNAALTSAQIDLTGIGTVALSFESDCNTESTYDFCIVEVTADGNNWSEVARYDGNDGSFVNRALTVNSIGGSNAAQVRFRLTTDVTIVRDGWYVDDVSVRGAGAQCVTVADTDSDGVNDLLDNCTLIANLDQFDTNGDGYGNACDPDISNDGIVNAVDLGLFKQSFFAPGVTDTDFNGDGITNAVDLGILKTFFFSPPGPAAFGN